MKLSKDLREFIGLLNSKGIKFIIVGGHAVQSQGLTSSALGRPKPPL